MKEIESAADGDYSAYEYPYWEKNFHPDLDDPEYRPIEKGRMTWRIKGVRGTKDAPNRAKIMRSPPAYIGGYWWTIKFFPRGNNVGSLSIYLECSPTMPSGDKTLPETHFAVRRGPAGQPLGKDEEEVCTALPPADPAWVDTFKAQYPAAARCDGTGPKTWRVSAQIGVILYNPDEPRTGWMQSSSHQFNPHNLDWGWTNFHGPWDQIHRRQRGQRQALLRGDTLAFDAYIRVVDDPTCSLWWHASDSEPTWDSLGLTGYRPLGDSVINHSAEVAGLASWLHLAPFGRIIQQANVLEHHTNGAVKPKPLCDALQKFLWQLRARDQSLQYVDTDAITSTLRNLHEYAGDVCEFWESLRRTLQLELAGTPAADDLARLFDSPVPAAILRDAPEPAGGIHTLPREANSRIRVPADQAASTQEALRGYLGAQPGRWVLPPVLHVELNRQRLDKAARQWRLLYNRVEPDEEVDLTPWVLEGECGRYVLYGYVVHRGRRTSGKFFSILRPGGPGTRWLAFDDGSDNRVECLTRKTAFGPHLGLDASQKPDHKTGHDVAIAVMYIRADVVDEFLPGPQGPWETSPAMKTYYEQGTAPVSMPDGAPTPDAVPVEVYTMPEYDQLDSLFDTYDLMAQAQSAGRVQHLTVPRGSTLQDLRKTIVGGHATDAEAPLRPEHVRLWQIGHTRERFGPTLAFSRVSDLTATVDGSLGPVRFWMQVVSDGDAKYFAMADPREAAVAVNKVEEAVPEQAGAEPDRPATGSADAALASSSGTVTQSAESSDDSVVNGVVDSPAPLEPAVPVEVQEPAETHTPAEAAAPVTPSAEPARQDSLTGDAENDAVIAAIIASDVQQLEPEPSEPTAPVAEPVPEPTPAPAEPATSPAAPAATEAPETTEAPSADEQAVTLPVEHVYYFIQLFDVEAQALRTVGSFFSQKEENIKKALRKHLQRPVTKDFQIWQRVDGTSVTTVSSLESFQGFVPDGTCFIVGDKLSKDRRSQLNEAGLLTNPDHLVRYLWAAARNHPTKAFTGRKTVDASFTTDYYSGDFCKGYHHGVGKHVSDTVVTYEGDFVLGKRHGQGRMEYPTGDTYDGSWAENQCHGQGTFVEHKTGNRYVGGYKDGKRHGKGISYWEVADEEMDLCQICYSEEQDALFYDCGHVCACVTCARQVDLCPICRKSIISVVKIYRT
ncbi:MATH and UCH domain protein [Aspergillus taichungensis]|uniref:MATH and UCH domain protein n=1 Tax=Aspergillus taichungensis TaxID=482145 RepID=A0A2J5HTF5_9EURO|nr:MATH and UCH domain protein [Aspergillus taichungensis]